MCAPARRVSVASSLVFRAPARRRRENNLKFTPRPSAWSFASRRASHRASSRRSSVPRLSTPSAPDNRLCGACAGGRRRRQSSVVVRFFEFHPHGRGRDRRRFVPRASRLATTKRAIAARKEPARVAPRASVALARARTLKRFPCNRRAMNDARRLLSCSVVLTRVFPHVCVLSLARGRARLPVRAAVDGGGRARGGVARASRRERHGERDRSARQERARDGSAGARWFDSDEDSRTAAWNARASGRVRARESERARESDGARAGTDDWCVRSRARRRRISWSASRGIRCTP